jgi:tetratricopeptide (TPR) repeat protein
MPEVAEYETVEEAPSPTRQQRVDRALNAALLVLLAAVVLLGAWFGWTVYQTRVASRNATPALRALRVLEKSAKSAPNSAAMRVRLGEAQAAAGLYDDAVTNLKAAIKLDKKHTGAFLDLGIIALIKNDLTSAEAYFQKVVDLTAGSEFQDLNQRREQAYYYLGRIYLLQKQYEDALRYLKGAQRIRDDASDTYLGLAEAYKGLGEYDAATQNAELALSFDPNYPEGHFLLGQIHEAAGSETSAAVEYRRAVQLDEDIQVFNEALDALGPASKRIALARASMASGENTAALEQATIAYAVEPENVTAVKLYAELTEKVGKATSALVIYREAQKLAPDDVTVKAAVARLEALAKKPAAPSGSKK